jgi:hypothetical protein
VPCQRRLDGTWYPRPHSFPFGHTACGLVFPFSLPGPSFGTEATRVAP